MQNPGSDVSDPYDDVEINDKHLSLSNPKYLKENPGANAVATGVGTKNVGNVLVCLNDSTPGSLIATHVLEVVA